jgi:hypothetical protein
VFINGKQINISKPDRPTFSLAASNFACEGNMNLYGVYLAIMAEDKAPKQYELQRFSVDPPGFIRPDSSSLRHSAGSRPWELGAGTSTEEPRPVLTFPHSYDRYLLFTLFLKEPAKLKGPPYRLCTVSLTIAVGGRPFDLVLVLQKPKR